MSKRLFKCKSLEHGTSVIEAGTPSEAAVRFVSEYVGDLSFVDDFEGGLTEVETVFVYDPDTSDCIALINVSATIKVHGVEFSNWGGEG